MTIYWEDIAEGSTLEGGAFHFTAEDIKRFAREFDPRPTHTDEAAAAETFVGELIASGIHTMGAWARLWWDLSSDYATSVGADMRALRMVNPVKPGDVLSLAVEITGKYAHPFNRDLGLIESRHVVTNQHGKKVMRIECRLMVGRRPR